MFRNEITINTISLRSNSNESLGKYGGGEEGKRGRGKEKKKKKRSIVPPTCTRG